MDRRTFLTATLAVLAGCGHGEAFRAPDPWARGPLVPGAIARLTYSAGRDQSPAWRADGSGILYTFEDVTTGVRGWCLGVLPADGGSRTLSRCGLQRADSVYAYDWAAESPDGRIAALRAISLRFAFGPYDWALVVAPGTDPAAGTRVVSIPFTSTTGLLVQGLSQVRWLDPATLIMVGERRFVGAPCRGCAVDTVATGRMLLTIPASGGTPAVVAGTDYATSVAVRTSDEIFLTRGGDSRIYRRALAAGVTTAVWDFGPGQIARDVPVAGERLVAVVGGQVTWGLDPNVGDSTQVDGGGVLAVVELTSGTVQTLDPGFAVRRPALSADGRRAVVETGAGPADLYLMQLP